MIHIRWYCQHTLNGILYVYVAVPDPDIKVGLGTYVYRSGVFRKGSVWLENANLFPRCLYYFRYTKFQGVGDIQGMNTDLDMKVR